MFKLNKSYLLLSIIILGLSGCAKKRVLLITEQSIRHTHPRVIHTTNNNSSIKEEILIKNNPNLVNSHIDEVEVPINHPILDIKATSQSVKSAAELNGKTMKRMPFPVDEYRQLKKFGRNIVHGKVYLQNSINDEEVLGKRIELFLNPVTSYSKQWYNKSYLGGYKLTPADKRLFNYLKSTKSDKNGKFIFFSVPKGKYYLIGRITCGKECGFNSTKIIRLAKEVYVNGTTDVKLTNIVP
ncbi:MAG: carboxypeptidase regulatory-like domain-containing protein [Sulfurovaceae bacterium]|nr:carboxypeptidase regulatory-like domain-containing protein [Sulfurovaceae bacterium]